MKRWVSVFVATSLLVLGSWLMFAQAPQQGQRGQGAPPAAGGGGGGGQRGQQAPPNPMGFFITSVGKGDGANLGGLAGADAHCQALAAAAGAGSRTWRAYLSTTASGGQPAVNARDRIGSGPWYDQTGRQVIAQNVADLHGDTQRDRNQINEETALTEKGMPVNGRGSQPNQHDMLTGSDSTGRALPGEAMMTTCNNWTSNAPPPAQGQQPTARAMLGHHDRSGGGNSSWNAAHLSQGCNQQALVNTGGAGLFYCFAAN
jgi:hypothetical protein